MNDHIAGLSEIRAYWASTPGSAFDPEARDLKRLRESVFDSFLAEHDRQVKADAWDEGAKAQADAYGMDVDTGPNPYRTEESN